LKRSEAVLVLKELLDKCKCLDGHAVELVPPATSTEGYQIIIKGVIEGETMRHINDILVEHQLTSQVGSMWKTKWSTNKNEPDTLVIYRK
jgi:hypothetical protein